MKKGFTLIEIISVIVILGIIGLIAIPVSNKIINNSKEKILTEQISRIVSACKSYVADSDEDLLPDEVEGSTKTVSIDVLRNNGYLNSKDLINPKTGNILTGSITITYTDNEYVYDYQVEEIIVGDYVYFQQTGEFTSLNQTTLLPDLSKKIYLKIKKKDLTKVQVCGNVNGTELCIDPNDYETSKQKILDYFEYDANTWTIATANVENNSNNLVLLDAKAKEGIGDTWVNGDKTCLIDYKFHESDLEVFTRCWDSTLVVDIYSGKAAGFTVPKNVGDDIWTWRCDKDDKFACHFD